MTVRRKKPILLLSPLPPPQGGIAVWTKKIVECGLPDGSMLQLVDTRIRSGRNIFDQATLSIAEIKRTLRIVGLLIFYIFSKKPSIIHINCSLSSIGVFRDWFCATIAKIFKIPVIVHFHGNLHDFQSSRFRGLSQYTLSSLIKMAEINIVINKLSLNKFQAMYAKQVRLLPNFIEEPLFNSVTKFFNKPRLRAIFAGGITKAKGCKEIFYLAQQLPEIDFYLFGKMHADMMDLDSNLPMNIFLQGEVPHSYLLNELQKSDFLLFPSYTEGFPLTVLEAMAVGLPVISTRVGAIPEMIVEKEGGILVEPGDVSGLMNAIKMISKDQPLRLAMGDFNKKYSFENYRYSVVINQLIKIYDEVMENRRCVG